MHIRRILIGLGWAYPLLIGLWLLLRAMFFDHLWWLALINTLSLYLFLPLVIVVPLAFWLRAWPLLLAQSLPGLAFVYFFGALFMPVPTVLGGQGHAQLTAMTLNMLWSNEDDAAILAAIQQANPDLIGLQEVTPDTEERLTRQLATAYPYVAADPIRRFHNILLLSRWPITAVTTSFQTPIERALQATVLVNERAVTVFVAHLTPSNVLMYPSDEFATYTEDCYSERLREAQSLAQAIRNSTNPALLLCDCNFTSTSEAYAALQTVALDSFPGAGWGFGHTAQVAELPFPLLRIDYIWHTPKLVARRATVGPAVGSDHWPLIVELGFGF